MTQINRYGCVSSSDDDELHSAVVPSKGRALPKATLTQSNYDFCDTNIISPPFTPPLRLGRSGAGVSHGKVLENGIGFPWREPPLKQSHQRYLPESTIDARGSLKGTHTLLLSIGETGCPRSQQLSLFSNTWHGNGSVWV